MDGRFALALTSSFDLFGGAGFLSQLLAVIFQDLALPHKISNPSNVAVLQGIGELDLGAGQAVLCFNQGVDLAKLFLGLTKLHVIRRDDRADVVVGLHEIVGQAKGLLHLSHFLHTGEPEVHRPLGAHVRLELSPEHGSVEIPNRSEHLLRAEGFAEISDRLHILLQSGSIGARLLDRLPKLFPGLLPLKQQLDVDRISHCPNMLPNAACNSSFVLGFATFLVSDPPKACFTMIAIVWKSW